MLLYTNILSLTKYNPFTELTMKINLTKVLADVKKRL